MQHLAQWVIILIQRLQLDIGFTGKPHSSLEFDILTSDVTMTHIVLQGSVQDSFLFTRQLYHKNNKIGYQKITFC